jgi:aminopeptidase N
MTRDAEWPARSFVDLVLAHLDSLADPSVTQTLLRQLAGALDFYVADEHRVEVLIDAADRLLALLTTADPGSDLQLLLARSFAVHATSSAQLDVLAGLLDGSRPIAGLSVDTEMRWGLLVALVAGGRLSEAEIEAELSRDGTATGRLHAATARAAMPTAAAKAAAWKSVVEDAQLPNAVQAAVIAGFGRVRDRSLLAPFVEPYFRALAGVWADRTNEMASQIVVGMYPSTQPADVVLPHTDAWLAGPTQEPALRRLVIEGRDAVERAQRAQSCDRAG